MVYLMLYTCLLRKAASFYVECLYEIKVCPYRCPAYFRCVSEGNSSCNLSLISLLILPRVTHCLTGMLTFPVPSVYVL